VDVDLIEVGRRAPLERFRDFAEPRYAKIISELSVRSLGDGGTGRAQTYRDDGRSRSSLVPA